MKNNLNKEFLNNISNYILLVGGDKVIYQLIREWDFNKPSKEVIENLKYTFCSEAIDNVKDLIARLNNRLKMQPSKKT